MRSARIFAIAIAVAACPLGGCNKDNQQAGMPASDSANLVLQQGTSSPALADVPATTTPAAEPAPTGAPAAAPQPAPSKQASAPSPNKAPPKSAAAPAAPANMTAAAGSHMTLTVDEAISSRTATAGQAFTAKVAADVKDANGHVVIPAGSTVSGTVTEVKPGRPGSEGTMTLAVKSVTVRGNSYPIDATIQSATTENQERGITGKEAAKVGAGAAAGAIAGRILGKNTRGTIIGAVVGAAAGTGVAAATRDVDIVLPAGGRVEVVLNSPVTVAAK